MNLGNLPTEIAQEPAEEAQLSQGEENVETKTNFFIETKTPVVKNITFVDTSQFTQNSLSQTLAYRFQNDDLNLPPPSLTHRQRLQWLQQRRCTGLWAQCHDCLSWRYLPDVLDAHELPQTWKCKMNPDKSAADCSVPEAPIRVRTDEDLILGDYSVGSLVWARLSGWPWWPAMVDDDPDIEQYYWSEGFVDKVTHYNVTYFDSLEVTRSWLALEDLQPFGPNKKFHILPKDKETKTRMKVAIAQAEDAEKLPLAARLSKYSFISRYSGPINTPRKINKDELLKYKKKLIGNYYYYIVFSDDSSESSDDDNVDNITARKRHRSVLLVGNPKTVNSNRKKTRRFSAH